jgi:hypothetical protein
VLWLAAAFGLASAGMVLRLSAEEDNPLLPLPVWTEQDRLLLKDEPQALPLGGLLWPEGFGPDSLPAPDLSPMRMPPEGLLADGAPGMYRKPAEGFLLFIPKAPSSRAGQPAPIATPPNRLVEVGPDFLREIEEIEPDGALLDPHVLLAETESEDLRRLLSYHAGEASTFANFLLLGSDEQLPASAELSRLARGRLAQDHSCLAVYPLAEPWRARIFMTREIAAGVPAEYLRGILQACIQDALQASDSVEQLQRFATQLSIRLIWMERAHPKIFAPPAETVLPAIPSGPLPEPSLSEVVHAPGPSASRALFAVRWQPMAIVAATSLGGLLLLFLILRALLRWRRRRTRNSVWLLPEVEVKPRFGAPHCGQGGAWIKFG